MTTINIEDQLVFDFDGTWIVVKWDDEPSYREGLGAGCVSHNATAVDMLATQNHSTVHMIEVKDPRGHSTEYRVANSNEQIAVIIGAKVRDTIAGLVYARKRIDAPHLLAHVKAIFQERKSRIWVVFWYEADHVRAPLAATLKGLIEVELNWLKPKVIVTNRALGHTLPGLAVRSLAGAPHTP